MSDETRGAGALTSLSVRRPILAVVMNLLIVLAGLSALMGVDVRELPDVDRPVATVRVNFPGASPETLDSEVTRVLEGAAARVPGVKSIRSSSEENNARIYVEFIASVDLDVAASDLREAVNGVINRLPDGVEDLRVLKANDDDTPIVRLSVASETLTNEALTTVIDDQIVPEFMGIPGVADVRIFGQLDRNLNIVVDPLRLASHGLSVADVRDAMATAKFDVPAGSVRSDEQDLIVRADATVVEEAAVERIVIADGIRIRDVAQVHYGPEEAESYVRLDGRPVISLGIVRQARSNTIEISRGVDAVLAQLHRRLPDVEITKTSDDSVFIDGAIREVLLTLSLGVLIVIGVIWLFLRSARATVIPAVTIPVALIGTVAAIWLLGFSINILTLLALVLAIGLVVDDAIVVLENIERTRRAGHGRLAAAVLGTRQVFFAVVATTVTLASVFIPIAFLPGTTGQLFEEFGYTLAIAVIISSFVALTLCPMLASRMVGAGPGGPSMAGAARRGLGALGTSLARLYERMLGIAYRAPIPVVGGIVAAATLAAALYTTLDHELVPSEDRGVISVFMRGPDGVNLGFTDRQVRQVEAALDPLVESGEVTAVQSIIGRWDKSIGWITAPLAPWSERDRSQQEIAAELGPKLDAIPGAWAIVRRPNSLSIRTSGFGLEFALTGPDYGRIAAAGETLIAAMDERLEGVTNTTMSYAATQPQLSVVVDRERASDLGVDVDGVAATLRAMIDGLEVAELNVGDDAVPIVVRSAAGAIDDTDDLRNLFVAGRDGALIPLSSLVSVVEGGVAAELDRRVQRRAIDIDADLAEGYPLNQAVADLETLAAEVLPPGIDLVLLGQAEALEEAESDIWITFGIALVVVLLVLAAQFESFASAAVVMTTVPFGLAAAVLALWLTGTSLNIYSQIGLVMLVGLMAKNGILIVEFADQLRNAGRSAADAAFEAAKVRLRPVVMTMLSTILAGLPLVLSGGPGAEARQSIGWVVVGGLGFAILATIFLTPLAYRFVAPIARPRGDFGRALEAELDASHARTLPKAAE